MSVINMEEIDLAGKRVLIREDLNVPFTDGKIANDARMRAALPTIRRVAGAGAAVILMSHLGRPREGEFDERYSLAPIAIRLSELLDKKINFVEDWLDGFDMQPGEIVLLENVRFNKGEKSCDDELSKKMASLCDVFVMDAFGTAHRKQASTYGVAKYARVACAGPLLEKELEALGLAFENPQRPMIAIVGGSKVSTKLTVLETLSTVVDQLIVGGGIANTFIAAAGHNVGKSLYEANMVDTARSLSIKGFEGAAIPMPYDVVVGNVFSAQASATIKDICDVDSNDLILDIGPKTSTYFASLIKNAGTIIWNGPLGVFEFDQFGAGTRVVAEAIAASKAFSIAGGGDTLAAVEKYDVADGLSYISTGGGAFLEFAEGKELPAIEILKQRRSG